MQGFLSEEQNEKRRRTMAAREAVAIIENDLAAQQSARAAGIGETVQVSGAYNEAGEWEHYLRCGDPLDSGGCAP